MCLSQGVLTCVCLSQDVLTSNKASMAAMQAEQAETKDSVRQLKVSRLLWVGGWGGASAQPMCTAGRVLTDLSTSVKSHNGVLQAQKLKVPPGLRSSCPSVTYVWICCTGTAFSPGLAQLAERWRAGHAWGCKWHPMLGPSPHSRGTMMPDVDGDSSVCPARCHRGCWSLCIETSSWTIWNTSQVLTLCGLPAWMTRSFFDFVEMLTAGKWAEENHLLNLKKSVTPLIMSCMSSCSTATSSGENCVVGTVLHPFEFALKCSCEETFVCWGGGGGVVTRATSTNIPGSSWHKPPTRY